MTRSTRPAAIDPAPTHAREPSHNRALGIDGEALAAAYLEQQGLRIIERNWRNRHGELDLIARDHGALVAVEVKTRSGSGYGSPLEAITPRKTARLRRLLLDWAREHPAPGLRLRIDAVGITLGAENSPRIDHLRGIS